MKKPMLSFARLPSVVFMVGAAALLGSLAAPARALTIDWVTVGDPGNTADTTGDPNPAGAVADEFQIMKFEFTNQQYTDFLNSVDPDGNNPNSVYNANMGVGFRGGISFTSGNASGSKYAIRPNMGDKPVNFVSWFDAARVSNWLMNGRTSSSSMETGAYTLNNAISGDAPAVNPGATFYIPTEGQWYKAAYYKGGDTNSGYWDYATQSDTAPTAVTAGTTGIGSAGSTGNFANYNDVADWNGQDGNVTTVGTNGGASAYGAFDMSGNVFEWNDLTGAAGSSRGLRGGNWLYSAFYLSSSNSNTFVPSDGGSDIGFRLASPVAVPEPSTWVMGLAGLACGGWQMVRRRRAR
jgi:formylglycine-generating enzyme